MNCRFCNSPLKHVFVSLGSTPLENTYLTADQLNNMEPYYPLEVYVCERCFLVQLEEFESPEMIFGDYAYFSSYADTWQRHIRAYADKMTDLLRLGGGSYVVEIASNDGCLLQNFIAKGIPVLGIEPARNVAEVARKNGVPTETVFFSRETAQELASKGGRADLLLGNNVLAHVPNLNSFVSGMKIMLKPRGVITVEFPHLMRLMAGLQFDTIYHEHFSYFSFLTVEKVFAAHGLTLFDVEELEIHGGSLRIYARHAEDNARPVSEHVAELRQREIDAGFADINNYLGYGDKVKAVKRRILTFLIQAKEAGKSVVGYGAPAKGNTLLNYCGIRTDFIDYTVDRSPHKQGHYLPGTHIPVEAPDKVKETKPDYVFILPWNLMDEIVEQMSYIREWGGRFVIPIPELTVI